MYIDLHISIACAPPWLFSRTVCIPENLVDFLQHKICVPIAGEHAPQCAFPKQVETQARKFASPDGATNGLDPNQNGIHANIQIHTSANTREFGEKLPQRAHTPTISIPSLANLALRSGQLQPPKLQHSKIERQNLRK